MDGSNNHEIIFDEAAIRLCSIAVAAACLGWHCSSEGASVQVNGRRANRKATDMLPIHLLLSQIAINQSVRVPRDRLPNLFLQTSHFV